MAGKTSTAETPRQRRLEFTGHRAWASSPLAYLRLQFSKSKTLSDYEMYHLKRLLRNYTEQPLTLEQEIVAAAALWSYREQLRTREAMDKVQPNTREYRMASSANCRHTANFKKAMGVGPVALKRESKRRPQKAMWEKSPSTPTEEEAQADSDADASTA